MRGLSRIKGLKLRQRLSIFVLLMLLSGCITVRVYNGVNNSKWLEVNSPPGEAEVASTISPSPTTITPKTNTSITQRTIKPETWYHLAVTRQDRSITTFLDGSAISSEDFDPINLDAPISLKIGRREGYQGFFLDGRIDEVEIYKGLALTPGQIFAVYSAGTLGNCKDYYSFPCLPPLVGLTGWWPGDGNSDDIVNSRNGKFLGGAATETGIVDSAFVLDGESDYIEVPDDPALNFGTGNFTIALWVNFDDISGEQVIIEKWIQADQQEHTFSQGWSLTKLADQAILFAIDDGSD